MPLFLHLPSNTTVESQNAAQTSRYRRSHRFTELTDTDNHYHSPTQSGPSSLPDSSSSPTEASNQPPTPPDQPPESLHSPTNALHGLEPDPDDLTLTDIVKASTVADILDWVNSDPDRARQALNAETQGRNRVTLTSKLRRIR